MYICSVCGDEVDVLYGDNMCLHCFDEEYGDDADTFCFDEQCGDDDDSFYDAEEYCDDDPEEAYVKDECCRVCGNSINPFDEGYFLCLCDSCIEEEKF